VGNLVSGGPVGSRVREGRGSRPGACGAAEPCCTDEVFLLRGSPGDVERCFGLAGPEAPPSCNSRALKCQG
jgi:hypothetical protein